MAIVSLRLNNTCSLREPQLENGLKSLYQLTKMVSLTSNVQSYPLMPFNQNLSQSWTHQNKLFSYTCKIMDQIHHWATSLYQMGMARTSHFHWRTSLEVLNWSTLRRLTHWKEYSWQINLILNILMMQCITGLPEDRKARI